MNEDHLDVSKLLKDAQALGAHIKEMEAALNAKRAEFKTLWYQANQALQREATAAGVDVDDGMATPRSGARRGRPRAGQAAIPERIVSFVRQTPSKIYSVDEIAEAIGAARATVSATMSRLKNEIENVGRGQWQAKGSVKRREATSN